LARDDWDRRWTERLPDAPTGPNRFLVAETESLAPGRALDLACGNGRNAVWLAERGWQVTGIDFSPVALAAARRLAAEWGVEVAWIERDVMELELEEASFDLVLVLYLQVPAAERQLVLEHASVALVPGGTVLVVGHDSRNLLDGWGGPKDPAVLFTAEDVVAELPGLRVERAERVDRPVELDGTVRVAIDALVRASRPVVEHAGGR
jgi:SAM-dependent methyltransferase